MLFGKLHCELVQDLLSVAFESCVKSARTIDDNEPKWWFGNQKLLLQVVEEKFAFATVNGQVDWLEWLKVADEFLLGC